MRSAEFDEILKALARHDVEFVLVGLLSAVLQGAPVTTFDVDIVHRRTEENVARLLAALQTLDARYRDDPRNLRPTAKLLVLPGHALLETKFGDLDVLGALHDGETYESLTPHAVALDIGGTTILALGLAKLIDVKRRANRDKDRAVLPVLEAALEEALEEAGR